MIGVRTSIPSLGLMLVFACGPEQTFDPTPGTADDGSSSATGETTGAAPTSSATEVGTTSVGETDETGEDSGSESSGGDPLNCPSIEDPGLEQLIRGRLELPKGPITRAAAEALEVLNAPGLDIPPVGSLAGIECLANLREIWIPGGTFTDLAPLAALTKLEHLDLQGNQQLADLGPLAGSTTLRYLIVSGSAVSELAPLSGLKTLEWLDLRDAVKVSELGPLAGLPLLGGLLAADTAITDIAVVAELPALHTLHIQRTKVSSFAPLAGHGLGSLMASETTPVDLEGLGQAKALFSLILNDSGVTDLSGLAGATALETLDLSGNAIVDLGPLAGMDELGHLSIERNLVADLSPLAGLPALWRLMVTDNEVVDLTPLMDLPLRYLHAAGNKISDPSPLAALELQMLDLGRNPVGPQIAELGEQPALGELWLAQTGLKVVPVIPAAKWLRTLDLAGNTISDLGPLANYAALTTVTLTDNDITELNPLVTMPWLADEDCTQVALDKNPLSAESLAQVLPTLCAGEEAFVWDGGDCNECVFVPI